MSIDGRDKTEVLDMAEIISIRKMRQNSDPDVFINQVLNDPARLARVRAKQLEMREKARQEQEQQEKEAKEKEEFYSFLFKFSVGIAFFATVVATLVALAF